MVTEVSPRWRPVRTSLPTLRLCGRQRLASQSLVLRSDSAGNCEQDRGDQVVDRPWCPRDRQTRLMATRMKPECRNDDYRDHHQPSIVICLASRSAKREKAFVRPMGRETRSDEGYGHRRTRRQSTGRSPETPPTGDRRADWPISPAGQQPIGGNAATQRRTNPNEGLHTRQPVDGWYLHGLSQQGAQQHADQRPSPNIDSNRVIPVPDLSVASHKEAPAPSFTTPVSAEAKSSTVLKPCIGADREWRCAS